MSIIAKSLCQKSLLKFSHYRLRKSVKDVSDLNHNVGYAPKVKINLITVG